MTDPARLLLAPELDENVVWAIKSLAKGEATPVQQIDAVEFILHRLAGSDNQSFYPNDVSGGQNTAFLEGRRFVGRELRKIIITPSARLLETQKGRGGKPKVTDV